MKKSILRILSLALVAAMLFACTSCTQTILVRFVDAEGNDINFGGSSAPVNNNTDTPATEAPTAAPATEAPTAAPSGEVTTAAPSGEVTTAAPATEAPTAAPSGEVTTAAPATEAPTAAPAGNTVPTGKNAIADFYKAAINKVKNDAAAGYVKKEWQSISNLNITGIGTVDNKIAEIVGGYMTTAEQAEDQNSAKGSDDAKNRFPGFTADYNNIASAECTAGANGNYNIKIVSVKEDTPKKQGSIMGTFTSSYLAWEDITTEIDNNVSIVKDYKDTTHLYYTVVIEAEITPDGKFVSMKHTTGCDIQIDSAKILIATLKNKQAHLDNFCTYTNFSY